MKRLILLLALSILMINLIKADIILDPNPMDISVRIGQEESFNVLITNTFDFEVLDFEFENLTSYGFSFDPISIPKNSSKNMAFKVKADKSYHTAISTKVRSRYFVNIPQEITTHEINITPSGFSPNFLIIRSGDTVLWRNLDDITHTVTSGSFDYEIAPNQTTQHQFNQINYIDYQDLVMFFSGTINVINRSSQEKVYNPNYDANWLINFNSILNPTELEIKLIDDTFSVSASGKTEGLLQVKNNGTELAEILNFASDSSWISFKENNINLGKGEAKYITFVVAPIIFDSNLTNQTYNLNLKIKATNTNEYTRNISVFIPYSTVFQDIETDEGIMTWFAEVYCKAHPKLFFCNTSVIQEQGNNTVIYRDPEIPINVSLVTFYEMKKDIQKIKDSNERTDNQVKIMADKWGLTIPELMALLNESVGMQQKNAEKATTQKNVLWIVGFIVLILVVIAGIISLVNKKSYKKYLMEGQFQYQR